MKKVITTNSWSNSTSYKRKATYEFYYHKYFNLFMNSYKFNGITREQQDYVLRKLWATGTIASFIVEGTKLPEGEAPTSVNEYPNGMIAFAPYAPSQFDIYDFPIKANLVRVRGATFIPDTIQVVNKDIVIGYAQRSKRSVASIVEFYVNKIVDVEMTIAVQLTSHKVPWLVATTPENEEKLKRLFQRIENDEEVLYISADEVEAIKSLQGGNTYIIDKLFDYVKALDNELLTYLGFNNLGSIEKEEHLVVDEVNANNEVISDNSDNFLNSMQEWCERIREVFGYEMSVEATSSPVVKEQPQEDEEKGEEQDDNE